MLKRYQASRCLILSISCRRQLTFCEPLACVADKQRINSGQTKDKTISGQKRKAQKQRKSSVSELFDLVTRTGIENLGALFVACRDMQKSPKIRHFRAINKSCIYRKRNRSCTDLEPHSNGYKTAPLPLS